MQKPVVEKDLESNEKDEKGTNEEDDRKVCGEAVENSGNFDMEDKENDLVEKEIGVEGGSDSSDSFESD